MAVSDVLIQTIEDLKESKKYQEALDYTNTLMNQDPTDERLLLQIADIQYRSGAMDKATKAIDFLNHTTDNNDPMGLYMKGVLEMEKNNRQAARKYLRQAVESHDENNHEIMRCYALSEYWYGNRSKGLDMLDNAFASSKHDPEIVCNLIELYLLEHKYIKAQSLIAHFTKNKKSMVIHDKPMAYYTKTIGLYKQYAQAKLELRNASKREIVSV